MSDYERKQDEIRKLEMPKIDTFENMYQDREYEVVIKTGQGELSSICPKTGLPDFATMEISYEPNEKCIELKSFKEYIVAYRNIGIFHEFLANKIMEDLVNAVDPRRIFINIEMNPRGNIKTRVSLHYYIGEDTDSNILILEEEKV